MLSSLFFYSLLFLCIDINPIQQHKIIEITIIIIIHKHIKFLIPLRWQESQGPEVGSPYTVLIQLFDPHSLSSSHISPSILPQCIGEYSKIKKSWYIKVQNSVGFSLLKKQNPLIHLLVKHCESEVHA